LRAFRGILTGVPVYDASADTSGDKNSREQ